MRAKVWVAGVCVVLAACAPTEPPAPGTSAPAASAPRCPESLGTGLAATRLAASTGSEFATRFEGQFTGIVAIPTRLMLRYCAQRPGIVSLFAELPNPDRGRPGQPERLLVRLFDQRSLVAGEVASFPGLGDPDIRFSLPGPNVFLLVVSSRAVGLIEPGEIVDPTAMPRLRLSREALERRIRERFGAAQDLAWEVLTLETRAQRGGVAMIVP